MVSIAQLQRLMEQYTEGLIRLAFYYVKDSQTAEDIVQDVFIKLYMNSNGQIDNNRSRTLFIGYTGPESHYNYGEYIK